MTTVTVTEALKEPSVAVMVVVPLAKPLAMLVSLLLAVKVTRPAVAAVPLAQTTTLAGVWSEPSVYTSWAKIVMEFPMAMVGVPGVVVSRREAATAAPTVGVVVPLTPLKEAVMTEAASTVAVVGTLARPVALMVAALVFPEDQVAVEVTSFVLSSEYVATASNC